jgi:hypothetical protein
VGAAALAAALRWFRIDAQSLWYDEGISAFQLTRSFADILSAAALDTHPPLYYWTLKAWAGSIGASEVGLRSLSAAWGVAAVALTWLIGRRLFGALVGTLAALLLAVAPLAVYYSQEVRMYTQVTALGLLAVYAYSARTYWLYAVAGLAVLYTQYLGVALLVALNVHALIWWRSRSIRDWLMWLGANAVMALAFLPWLPTVLAQQTRALNTSPRTPQGLAVDTLTAYSGGIVRGDLFLAVGALFVALAIVGVVLSREPRSSSLCLLVWLAPLALVVALGIRSGLFELRYLLVSLPGLILLTALGIVRIARRPLLAGGLGLAAALPAVVALQQQYFDPALARDDYRGLSAAIERDARPTDAVILSAANQVEVFSYYYRGSLPTIGLPAERPVDRDKTRHSLDTIKRQYERIWLVSWAMSEADPAGVISTWLAENGFQATHAWYGTAQLALVGFESGRSPTEAVDTPLDNGIVLEGYRLASRSLKPGETVALTLVWRADRGPTTDRWKVFTHLLDGGSTVVAQRDAEPADNLRPTTTWQPGERVEDRYGIAIPANLAAGSYTLEIGMYAGERRSRFADRGDHLVLGQIQVQP